MKAILMLEDKRQFLGESIGVSGEKTGLVIFNTAVVGYQEMTTDPANAGKILVLTYPLIGNYGVAPKFNQSAKSWLSGLVIKEKSRIYSNWQAKTSFDNFIQEKQLLVISGIDTRTLAVHLRNKGEMLGIISTLTTNPKELSAKIEALRKNNAKDFIRKISVKKPLHLGKKNAKYKLAILDLGITQSMTSQLEALGFSLTILPYLAGPEQILRVRPNGLVISNGPEDDLSQKEIANNIRALIKKIPILGISTGCQVLASALGIKLTRMKLGHHGLNYPLNHAPSYRGEISAQNHSFCLDSESAHKLKEIKVTAYNLNDRSIEEIESKKLKILGVQYLPLSPGLGEVNPVFYRFRKMLTKE